MVNPWWFWGWALDGHWVYHINHHAKMASRFSWLKWPSVAVPRQLWDDVYARLRSAVSITFQAQGTELLQRYEPMGDVKHALTHGTPWQLVGVPSDPYPSTGLPLFRTSSFEGWTELYPKNRMFLQHRSGNQRYNSISSSIWYVLQNAKHRKTSGDPWSMD